MDSLGSVTNDLTKFEFQSLLKDVKAAGLQRISEYSLVNFFKGFGSWRVTPEHHVHSPSSSIY